MRHSLCMVVDDIDESLVALLQARPTMVERLAQEHVDDGAGRCSKCSSGAQTGRYRFPCLIKLAVDEARKSLREAGQELDR